MANVEDRWHDSDGERTSRYGRGLRWRVRWRDPNGEGKNRSFAKKSDADRYARNVETRKDRGEYLDPDEGRRTFEEFASSWYRSKVAISRKPSTVLDYRSILTTHVLPKIGNYPVAAIRYDDVVDLIAELEKSGRSASIRRRVIGYTSQVLDEAIRRNAISTNVARLVPLPVLPTRPRHRYLTHRELWKLADASEKYRSLVLLLGYTGLRWGEAVALRIRDVDSNRRTIDVYRSQTYNSEDYSIAYVSPKNHQRRTVPIVDAVLDELYLEGSPDDLLFTSPRGTQLRSSNFHKRWTRYVENSIGGGLRIHDLRHTAASLARASGADVFVVARMLGHKDPSVTAKIYADLFPEELDRLQRLLSDAVRDTLGTRENGTSRDGEGRVVPIDRGQRRFEVAD